MEGYGKRFGAVEMDSSFYRPPSPSTVTSWRDATPEDFSFTVRVPRQVTHVDRLRMPQRAARFVDSLGPLGPRLACLLFTLPPTLECEPDKLEATLDAIGPGVPTASEFRHGSWLTPEVLEMLAGHGATAVVVETLDGLNGKELLPGGTLADRVKMPFCYLRVRKDRYRPGDLLAWGEVLGEVVARGAPVFAFFRQSEESIAYATALSELLVEAQEGNTVPSAS